GTAQRGAQRNSTNHTSTIGRASSGCSTTAVTGARQIGSRMPASMALASGVGMRVIARPSAGHRPHSAISTPQTMKAPTAVEKLAPPLPAATSTAAPGVDHTTEMGWRWRHDSTIVMRPDATHNTSRPEDACASLAPTACSPAMTRAKEVAKPLMAATSPAETGWRRPGVPPLLLGRLLLARCLARNDRGRGTVDHGVAGDHHARDVVVGGHVEHDRGEHLFHDGPQASGTGLAQHREVSDRLERVALELELDPVELELALVLLDERVLRLGEDVHEGDLVERGDRSHDGQPADELGDEPELVQVFGQHLAEEVHVVALAVQRGAEADALLACTLRDDLLEPREGAGDDEEHVGGVDLDELL